VRGAASTAATAQEEDRVLGAWRGNLRSAPASIPHRPVEGAIRRAAIHHALLSYLVSVVVAIVISIVASPLGA
jgi:hypothetical protein